MVWRLSISTLCLADVEIYRIILSVSMIKNENCARYVGGYVRQGGTKMYLQHTGLSSTFVYLTIYKAFGYLEASDVQEKSEAIE
jgi:hypothetical protein